MGESCVSFDGTAAEMSFGSKLVQKMRCQKVLFKPAIAEMDPTEQQAGQNKQAENTYIWT